MPYVNIVAARYAVDAPLSTDLFSDIVNNLDFLNGSNLSSVDGGGAPLVLNGSFEQSANSIDADNWSFTPGTGGTGQVDNTAPNHGGWAFKVTRTATPLNSGGVLESSFFFNVSPSLSYQFRFMMNNSAADVRNIIVINWYDKNQGALSSTTLYDDGVGSNAPTSWRTVAVQVTPPASAVFGKLSISAGDSTLTPAATRSMFFDGFSCDVRPIFSQQTVLTTQQNFTVPSGVFVVKIRVWGQGSSIQGPHGGYAEKTINVRPGDTIAITTPSLSIGTLVVTHTPSSTVITVQDSSGGSNNGTATGGTLNRTGGSPFVGPSSRAVSLEY